MQLRKVGTTQGRIKDFGARGGGGGGVIGKGGGGTSTPNEGVGGSDVSSPIGVWGGVPTALQLSHFSSHKI